MWGKFKKQKSFTRFYISYVKRVFYVVLCMILILSMVSCKKKTEEAPIDIFNDISIAPSVSPAPSAPSDTTKNELTISMPGEFDTLHPLATKNDEISNLLSLVLEPGIRLTVAGKLEPCLIERWQVSEDGLQYTFVIRENITKHNGNLLQVEDFLYTIKRIAEAEPTDSLYTRYADAIEIYEKVDEKTFRITTTRKTNEILYLLTAPILAQDYYEGTSFTTKEKTPLGTGPYMVESYTAENGFVFVRNENWWKVAPVYEKIVALPIAGERITLGSDIMGEVEVLTTPNVVAGSYVVANETELYSTITPYMDCLVPNFNRRILQDNTIRKAVSLAINRSQLIFVGLFGLGEPTATPLRPNYWAFTEETYAAIYDEKQANALLDEAGYYLDEEREEGPLRYMTNEDGTKRYLQFEILYTENPEYEYRGNVIQIIKEDLARIGIEVVITKESQEVYLERLGKKDFDMAFCNFYMYANHDITFLFSEPYNYGAYAWSDLRVLANACDSAITEEEAGIAMNALQHELLQTMPIIGLYCKESAVVCSAELQLQHNLVFRNVYANIQEWKRKKE